MDQKYELKFQDITSVWWIVKFYVNAWVGAVEPLYGSDSPLQFDFDSASDDVFEPWHPTSVKIELAVTENFKFTDLFTDDNMSTFVEVYQQSDSPNNLFWNGWVDPEQYEEPYDKPPFYLTIIAVDGLKYLDEIPFVEEILSDGTLVPYFKRASIATIIFDILKEIGHSEFSEFINIYEGSMTKTRSTSPFTQLLINREVFMEMSCRDTLVEVLKPFGARIRLWKGKFLIYRASDLTQPVLYGRYFTTPLSYTETSFRPKQNIQRQGAFQNSPLRQIPGGTVMHQSPAKRVEIDFDYGNRDTWVLNPNFHVDTYDKDNFKFKNWDNSGATHNQPGVPVYPLNTVLPLEEEGIMIIDGGAIFQTIGEYARQCGEDELFRLEFDYGFYSYYNYPGQIAKAQCLFTGGDSRLALSGGVWRVYRKRENNEYIDELEWGWSPWWENYGTIDTDKQELKYGWNGWNTFSAPLKSLPVDGPYTIGFLNYNNYSQIRLCIKNVRFTASSIYMAAMSRQRKLKLGGVLRIFALGATLQFKELRKFQRRRWVIGEAPEETDLIVSNTYLPVPYAENGRQKNYDFILGDIVKVSDPPMKGDTGISNNLEQFMGSFAVEANQTINEAAQLFVSVFRASYLDVNVGVSYYTDVNDGLPIIRFTALPLGTNLTGAGLSISNKNGIDGTITTVSSAQAGSRQLWRIVFDIPGPNDTAIITLNVVEYPIAYFGSLRASIDQFVLQNKSAIEAVHGITIDKYNNRLDFRGAIDGASFTYNFNSTGGFTGTATLVTAASTITPRIDEIKLTGVSGNATLSCNGRSATIFIGKHIVTASSQWVTGDGVSYTWEVKPLLQLLGDEIAAQYARIKQVLQIPIIESAWDLNTTLNITGLFEDIFDSFEGVPRQFIANRASLNARMRKWDIDLIELLPYDGPPPPIEEPEWPVEPEPSEPVPEPSEPEPEPSEPEPSEPTPEPSEDAGAEITDISIPGTGRMGTQMVATISYTASDNMVATLQWYLSSDYAGLSQVTIPATKNVPLTQGSHTLIFTDASYQTGAAYLQVRFIQDLAYKTSNAFTTIMVSIESMYNVNTDQSFPGFILPEVAFYASVATGGILTVYYRIYERGNIIGSGSQQFNFTTSGKYIFNPMALPVSEYARHGCYVAIGWTAGTMSSYTNDFTIWPGMA